MGVRCKNFGLLGTMDGLPSRVYREITRTVWHSLSASVSSTHRYQLRPNRPQGWDTAPDNILHSQRSFVCIWLCASTRGSDVVRCLAGAGCREVGGTRCGFWFRPWFPLDGWCAAEDNEDRPADGKTPDLCSFVCLSADGKCRHVTTYHFAFTFTVTLSSEEQHKSD